MADGSLELPVQPIKEFARDAAAAKAPAVGLPPDVLPAAHDQEAPSRVDLARISASPKSAILHRSKNLIPVDESARRSRRRARRRKEHIRRRRISRATVALVAAGAFAAGFAWKVVAAHLASAPPAPADPASQAEALRLVDDAVSAKAAKDYIRATAAAAAARKADPNVPGVDALVGEIALETGQPDVMRRAAHEALARGQNKASANLLLALEKWMMRARAGGASGAAQAASLLLAEGAADEMSNDAVFFYWGDIERHAGREDLAHDRLQGALHRMHPWHSVDILTAKMQLAAAEAQSPPEAAGGAMPAVPSTAAGRALVDLRRASVSQRDPSPALAALRGAVTARQANLLLGDQAFGASDPPPWLAKARAQNAASIPARKILPPPATSIKQATE